MAGSVDESLSFNSKPLSLSRSLYSVIVSMLVELQQELDQIDAQRRGRAFIPIVRGEGQLVNYRGRSLVDFANWDVFGLRWRVNCQRAVHQSVVNGGLVAGSSRFSSGTTFSHLVAEEQLAKFLSQESALLFSSKNQIILSLVTALFREGDVIFITDAARNPLVDAAALCNVDVLQFSIRDLSSLKVALERHRLAGRRGIFVESVSGTTGAIAPLQEIAHLATIHGGSVFVDESLALGLIGGRGAGCLEALDVRESVLSVYGSFGFAVGGFGGFCAGSSTLCRYLQNRSRTFSNEPSLPPAWCDFLVASIHAVEEQLLVRSKLQGWARDLIISLGSFGMESPSLASTIPPFVALRFARARDAREVHVQLVERGFLVDLDDHISEPLGGGVIRIIFHERHTEGNRTALERAVLETLDKKRALDGALLFSDRCQS